MNEAETCTNVTAGMSKPTKKSDTPHIKSQSTLSLYTIEGKCILIPLPLDYLYAFPVTGSLNQFIADQQSVISFRQLSNGIERSVLRRITDRR